MMAILYWVASGVVSCAGARMVEVNTELLASGQRGDIVKRAVLIFLALFATGFLGLKSSAAQPSAQINGQPSENFVTKELLLGLPENAGPLVVRAAFHLNDLDEIDDEAETFEFTGVLSFTWVDPRQAFDPTTAGVDEKIYQGDFQFNETSPAWYPQVILSNESGLFEQHGTLLRVKPDGTGILTQTVSAIAKASFDLRRYPFDAQRLNLVFEALGFDSNEVILEADSSPVVPTDLDLHLSQWTVTGIETVTRKQRAPYAGRLGVSSNFLVSIEVERQPWFVVRLVILPLILIVMLSWAVFWMDRSSLGDRINVSFIGILTAVAYQIVVGGLLPHISYFTLINGFLNISLLVMSATVVLNLIVGAYDKKGMLEVGDLIDRRCRWIVPSVYFGLLTLIFSVTFIFF